MENKHTRSLFIIIALVAIIIIAGLIVATVMNKQAMETVPAENTIVVPPTNEPQALVGTTSAGGQIIIDNLSVGQTIATPMTVTGIVKGWFFEGSFPVFMKDANGNQIGVGLASSSESWMTADPIPFSVTLPDTTYTGPGTLVFTKDNPSGESQYDDSYVLPVVFQ